MYPGEENSYTTKYKLIEPTEPGKVSDIKVEHDTDHVPRPSQGQTGDLEPGSNKADDNTVEECDYLTNTINVLQLCVTFISIFRNLSLVPFCMHDYWNKSLCDMHGISYDLL